MSNDNEAVALAAQREGWLAQKGNQYAVGIMALVLLGSLWVLSIDSRYIYLLV